MVGRSGHKNLDRLIDDVARGERQLSSIHNTELRESVRIALHLHADAPSVPDAYTKARMRTRVMARLDPRSRRLRDTAWTFLELLARPAPYIVRGVALGSLVLCFALAGFAASADALPDDTLYPVKIAAEQVRLALAAAPADRAAVEMSIAEHRLGEAEKLAATGRTSDALVASAFYSEHIAAAAAELAPADEIDLSMQLESRFSAQRERALSLAATLATDVKSERVDRARDDRDVPPRAWEDPGGARGGVGGDPRRRSRRRGRGGRASRRDEDRDRRRARDDSRGRDVARDSRRIARRASVDRTPDAAARGDAGSARFRGREDDA